MNIIYACEIDFSDTGGHITHISQFVDAIQNQDCNVKIVAPKTGRYNGATQLTIRYLPCIRYRFFALLSYEVVLFFYLVWLYLKGQVKLIYVRSELYSFGAPLFARIFNRPIIVEVNSLKLNELRANGKSSSLIRLVHLIQKFSFKQATKIVCTAKKIINALQAEYNVPRDKIEFIHNAANTKIFKPEAKSLALKKTDLDIPPNYDIVGFSGSIVIWQGLENLIKSAKIITAEITNICFLIVGDGPLKNKYVTMVRELGLENYFRFTGKVAFEKVSDYLNACDICVIPRDAGVVGEPVKLYEYMSCGKPIVAPNIDGYELVEQENIGRLTMPGNPESIAATIIDLLKEPSLREKMGKNGRQLVEEKYNWTYVAQYVRKIAESLLN